MPRIFISYRRADSMGITGRIHDRMVAAFGEENVFQDVENMQIGVDFRKFIREQIASCDVVLVVIGRQWTSTQDERGRKRLDNPADFVRIEIENALSQNKVVIPVLVENAAMPQETDVPSTMQELCYRHAAIVRHNPDFHRDVSKLIAAIEKLKVPNPSTSILTPQPPLQKIREGEQARIEVVSPKIEAKPIAKLVPPDVSKILPPPFEWCEIPAGKVTLTDVKEKYPGYLTKPTTFEVDHFWMAKYPITNAQYQVFVDAEDGYRNEKWWDYAEGAKQWRQNNLQAQKARFEGKDLPRTNVSWYEAVAFGRLLLAKLDSNNKWMITLPTEQQWQRAAQGDDGREYPWGKVFDKAKCNTKESEIGKVTPVTQYPQGESPFHVWDMAGNVWEWCLTEWESGDQTVEQVSDKKSRMLRGGAFNFAGNARCAFRGYYDPYVRYYVYGFRVVSVPI